MAVVETSRSRLHVTIHGAVQGVGFRPFVYRLANEFGLTGWVRNSTQGVSIDAEGDLEALGGFLTRLERERPPHSSVNKLESCLLEPAGYGSFQIGASVESEKAAWILPDIATCADCVEDIFDPTNRRYLYPFTNCTQCGPRFSIVESIPYDRANTTMKRFVMCERCRTEYEDPLDRRFHAQANACAECGPKLELWDPSARVLAAQHNALRHAVDALREGGIVALKGIGGFHLIVDARNTEAVRRLRARKRREQKPFALMVPSLEIAGGLCELTALEEELLRSPQAPIVLLRRREFAAVGSEVAPGNPYLGIMLPYSPLHHLLVRELGCPVVATSGNLSDEPICIDEKEAVQRLGKIVDFFLVHDRPIVRQLDDSVVRVMAGRELVLRRARGYAPLPLQVKERLPPVSALGGHLKSTIASAKNNEVFVSQHIGDLETPSACDAFQRVVTSFEGFWDFKAGAVACDLHPDYRSTKFARESRIPVIRVQHHEAHVLSCMVENGLEGSLLGVAWDGAGYGPDGTIWGSEFFHVSRSSLRRAAHFRPFLLPGGEKAIREPRRMALSLLYEIYGESALEMKERAAVSSFSAEELRVLGAMLQKRIHAPAACSAGRLFDGVAGILGLCQVNGFEGQGAMALEFATEGIETEESYRMEISAAASDQPVVIDWGPMLQAIIKDLGSGASKGMIAARFHNGLVEAIVSMALNVKEKKVVLSGGCFQNKYLTERSVTRLRSEGFEPYWHRRIPPNDGGLSLGQLFAAARRLKEV
jgi:hydrogenase maturation protein HypF